MRAVLMRLAVSVAMPALLLASGKVRAQEATATTRPAPPQALAPSTNQPPAPSTDTPPDAASPTQVGDIVVTAQRRSQNLQRVPIVITAVSGQQLAQSGVTSLTTLSTVAPGLNARTSGGGVFQPSIRGVGTSSNVVENPVALYIDGVYLPNQNEANRELPDVEQIAILKGPQGTLFGRNATGGVIQITTRRPTQQLQIEGSAEIDNYATFRGDAFVSGGLASRVAGSLSVAYATQGRGWGENLTTGNDTFRLAHSLTLRGKLLIEPAAGLSVTLIADYMDRKTYTYSFVPYPGTTFVRPLPGPYRREDTFSPVDPYAAFKGGGGSLTLEQEAGGVKLSSITAYRRGSTSYLFDDVPTGTPIFYVGVPNGDQPNRSISEELQASSIGDGPLTFAAGLFYFNNRNANLPVVRQFFPSFYAAAVGPPTANATTLTYGEERTESVAPYGQLGIRLFTGTTLTLGGRYTYERRALDGSVVLNRYNGTAATLPYQPAPLTIEKPTWRVALDHRFSPDVLAYVSYNRGIKSGGFNILNPANPAYLPEQLNAYEVGLKTELFGRRVRLNVGGFYYDYSNLQVTQFVGITQTIVNGAKARLYGADVDFEARVTPELRLSGGFELLNATFTSYPNAVGSTPKPTGGATLFPVDATGNRIPQAQPFTGTLAIDYEHKIGRDALIADVTGNHNGPYRFEADNFLRQGPYTLVNVSLGWRFANGLSLTVWGRNLLNEIVLNNGTSQAAGYPVSYGQPRRTVGATARFKL